MPPLDANLYGKPPPRSRKKENILSNSLDFASQLHTLLAADAAAPSTTGKSLASKRKDTGAKDAAEASSWSAPDPCGKKKGTLTLGKRKAPANDIQNGSAQLKLKSPMGTEDDKHELLGARRKMQAKARLYAAMRRGDHVAHEASAVLVDFDRKWAEAHPSDAENDKLSSEDTSDSDNNDTETVEYEDEFGRLRHGTRAQAERQRRRIARGEAAALELERMSARPKAPESLIVGDAVQTEAFAAAAEATGRGLEEMEALARKRDRSATPPEATHYDPNGEVRNRGAGFYAFSRDEHLRSKEMEALRRERENTERTKRDREARTEARRKDVEARRKLVAERRAKKMAESFLEGLGRDLLGRGADEDGERAGERQR